MREGFGMVHPVSEELLDHPFRIVFLYRQRGAVVEIFVEESLAQFAFGFDCWAEGGEAFVMMADVVEGVDSGSLQAGLRVGDEVADEAV